MDGFVLYLVLMAFGLVTGTLSAVLGVGGGIFMVPFLVLVASFEQHVAQATSLLVILPTAIVATVSLHRRGVGDISLGTRIGVLGIVGGVVGALLALELSGAVLRVIFATLLAVVGLRLINDGRKLPVAAGTS